MFDPVQKTLLADQGEIRVGSKYQAEIPDKLAEGEFEALGRKMFCPFESTNSNNFAFLGLTPFLLVSGESDNRVQEKLETKVWDPNNQLKDPQIDQFLVVAR